MDIFVAFAFFCILILSGMVIYLTRSAIKTGRINTGEASALFTLILCFAMLGFGGSLYDLAAKNDSSIFERLTGDTRTK